MNYISYGLQVMENDGATRPSYCGAPYMACCARSARYLLPALAVSLGDTPEAWRAASWSLLSSTLDEGTLRQYWTAARRHARQEMRGLARIGGAAHNYSLLRPGWCVCQPQGEQAYYMNPATGSHGWLCSHCRKTTQTG